MNKTRLATTIRGMAVEMIEQADSDSANYEVEKDRAELLRVLARIVLGDPVERAFGSPGDWGYQTPIGKAIAER